MALEPFISRKSLREIDEAAKTSVEDQLAYYGPRARFRVRWEWNEDRSILHVRTTMVRWEIHFGAPEPDHLTIYADVPRYISNFFSEKRQIQFKEEVLSKLADLGF